MKNPEKNGERNIKKKFFETSQQAFHVNILYSFVVSILLRVYVICI